MNLKEFWNSTGHYVLGVTKTAAMLAFVISSIIFNWVVPLVMLRSRPSIPLRTYLVLVGVSLLTTLLASLAIGLVTMARYWRGTRIPYKKLVDGNDKFQSCPVCGGQIVQHVFGGLMPIAGDPQCESCKRSFRLHSRFLLEDEFEVVSAALK